MPKNTFEKLPAEKKDRIIAVLKKQYSSLPFSKVSVKKIVEELDIARGSFYQYFDDLEDSYFYILDKELVDIHLLFINNMVESEYNLSKTLELIGGEICENIFHEKKYNIYKNRYLYWDEHLNSRWMKRQKHHYLKAGDVNLPVDVELINFIRSVIHGLIERTFREEWSEKEFLEKYKLHVNWIVKGVTYENI